MPASTRVVVALALAAVAVPAAGARAAVVHRAAVPLDAFASDGAAVVVGYRPVARRCAAVVLLEPRKAARRLTAPRGATCRTGTLRAGARVRALALAGRRAAWILRGRDLASAVPDTELERVDALLLQAAPGAAEAVLADGGSGVEATRALLPPRGAGRLVAWTVRGTFAGAGDDCGSDDPDASCDVAYRDVAADGTGSAGVDAAVLRAVDGGRLLVERDGALRVTSADGVELATLAIALPARADLGGALVAAVVRGTAPSRPVLVIADAASGVERSRFALRHRVELGPQVSGGIVVYVSGRAIRAVSAATGRDVRVALLPRGAQRVGFAVTGAGVAFAYNLRRRGVVERIARRTVLAALRRG